MRYTISMVRRKRTGKTQAVAASACKGKKLSTFTKVADRIEKLKIQGAHNIAVTAIRVLRDGIHSGARLKELTTGTKLLVQARPVEPALRNSVGIILETFRKAGKDQAVKRADTIIAELEDGRKQIAKFGAKLVRSGNVILTHCHSSTVMGILKNAHSLGKKFSVISTETRPKYQGRITARELNEFGIRTVMIVDSAANFYAKEVDAIMVGCDAITADGGIVNKIGTSTLALIAREHGIPFYASGSLLKFDPKTKYPESIERRSPDELIGKRTTEFRNVKVLNPAFDLTPPEFITGIITENGVLKPKNAVHLATRLLEDGY